MSYLNYDGLAYFKSKLTNWVDENYLSKTNTGNMTVAGNVTFTNPITGDLDGKAKKDWRGQKIDETYIKNISVNDNAGQIVYTKGDGSSNYIMIDLMQGATASAVGKAGLVPAPKISERDKFLRGDGEWGVPTDVYVTQNMISTNDSFPILIGATAGATTSQVGTPIAFGTKVSVNPNTHTLLADHLILKHPTYRRSNNITSKIMYTLNFADSDDGNGNNLSEIYGYIDPAANGGEHELGFRLFGNPNVQGVEEIFTYLSVGLSKTNVPYGHAPSTPLPADHNEPTDIITRDWLARNGSETGLVHTSMNETIDGTKTFVKKIVANDGMNATGDIATDTLTVRQDATVGRDLAVTRNETVGGTLTTTGNISTTNGNISTTNGTISGKTGSIGTGGLTVTGPSNLNGKVTAGNGLDVIGNETVSGNLTVSGTTTTEDLHVTDDAIIDDDLTISGDIFKKINNTTEEYVTYITNQQDVRETIINNLIKDNGGLAQDSNKNIYVKTGDGVKIDSNGYVTTRLQTNGGLQYIGSTANLKELAVKLATNGGLVLQSGAIKVDFSQLPEAQIRDIVDGMIAKDPVTGKYTGGLATNADGKLIVDFSELPSEVMINIVKNMVASGGGIYYDDDQYLNEGETYIDKNGNVKEVTAAQAAQTENGFPNPNYGKLLVDFNKMPDDKFNSLKDSLDMQRTLSASKTVYVDYDTAEDDVYRNKTTKIIDDTKGTEANPFKTIQGAVNFITRVYALGDNDVTIYVKPRIDSNNDSLTFPYYYENITLPAFTSTSGVINIKSYDLQNLTSIHNKSSNTTTVSCTGGTWKLYNLNIINDVRDPASIDRQYPNALKASGTEASVSVYGCHLEVNFKGTKAPFGTVTIGNLSAKPDKVMINNVILYLKDETYPSGQYCGWPYQAERPIINDNTKGIVTFLSPTWTAPTKTNGVTNSDGSLTFKYTFKANDGVTSASYPIVVDKDSTHLNVSYGNLEINTSQLTESASITMRCCHVSLASVSFIADRNSQTSFKAYHNNVTGVYTTGISGERQAYIQFSNSNYTDNPSIVYQENVANHVNIGESALAIPVEGQFSRFCGLTTGAQFTMFGGGHYYFYLFPYKVSNYYDSTSNTTKKAYRYMVSGKRYDLSSNAGCTAPRSIELKSDCIFTAPLTSAPDSEEASFVSFADFEHIRDTGDNAATNTLTAASTHQGFPGTTAGTPIDTDTSSFCWYKEYSSLSF